MIRALIITYYWPPAGGPGVQRWLKFVKYLHHFGIEPIVFVPENANYPLIDKALLGEVPSDIEIIKFPINEPYRWAKFFSRKQTKAFSSGIIPKERISPLGKILLYIRGNFFIPDARVGWVKPSVKFLRKKLKEHSVEVIITTGPPHSLHLIGMRLNEKTGIPWIADFRDPWTTIHYHDSLRLGKAAKKKHKRLELQVLNQADRVVVTSPTTAREFVALTPKPIEVITNGYDAVDLPEVNVDRYFSLSHIGSLLSERNPLILWKVLKEICEEKPSFKNNLRLKFAGALSGEVKDSLKKLGLEENSEFLGYVSHEEALSLQRQAQVLLLVEIDRAETRAIIPGKLFEYLAARRPILALGPEGSDIETILKDTHAGTFIHYSQPELLKSEILHCYSRFKAGGLHVKSTGVENYHRKELTKKMANLISEVVTNKKTSANRN